MKLSLKRFLERRKDGPAGKYDKAIRIALIVLAVILTPMILGGLILAGYIIILMQDLPSIDRLENPFAMSTVIYDRNGNEIYKIHGEENRKVVPLNDMSEYIRNATIAIEDKHFWTRPFLDFNRIIKAQISNYIWRSDQIQGASTITQQLVKNVFLSNEQTYERKLKEAILSFQVEQKYNREQILEMYLNQIPYGSNAYGIEQAAMTFFNKTAKDLTLTESVILAGLPNGPTYFSPFGQNPHLLMGYCKGDETVQGDTVTDASEGEQSIALTDDDVDLSQVEVKIVAANDVWMSLTVDGKKETLTLPGGEEKIVKGESVSINLGNNSPNIYANTLTVKIPKNLSFTLTPDTLTDYLEDPSDLEELKTFLANKEQGPEIGSGECTGMDDPNWVNGRKDLILLRMLEDGYITQEQVDQAWREAFDIKFNRYRQAINYPHFVFHVKSYLEEKYGQEVETAGWKVYTTLDPDLQKKAEETVVEYGNRNETRYGANQAALVSVDPNTGQIMAMVGSRDYWDEERDGNVNITTRRLQPGSSFKPYVYAAMFQGQYGTGSVLWDVKTGFGPLYPNNYDGTFRGPMTVRAALANSRNIPAIKAFFLAGEEDKVLEFVAKLGITSLKDYKESINADRAPEEQFHYGWPLALGTGEVTPLEMASGYSVFAAGGVRHEPTPILEIRDAEGNIVEKWEEDTKAKPVIDPQIAYEITDILSDESARPAGIWRQHLSVPGHRTAAKTGTSNKRYPNGTILPNNLWTVGYTRYLATAVWVGNTNGDALPASADGIGAASPIFHEYMKLAHEGKEALDFDRPAGLKNVSVSTLSGQLASANTPAGYSANELFASWAVPVKVDDSFAKVTVDKRNGFLANDLCPEDAVQEAIQFNVHSEMPDKPAWENPVQEWARRNLGALRGEEEGAEDQLIVFDKESPLCREFAENELPKVSIVSPQAFGTVAKGKVNVKVNIDAPFGIQKVEYFIDDMFQYETTDQPYDIGYVNMQHRFEDDSEHTIRVKVLDKNYNAATASVTVKIADDNSAPVLSFRSPSSGEQIPQGSTVQVSLDSYDENSNINEVELRFDGKVVKTFKQAPYKHALYLDPNNYGPGQYTLSATAIDDHNNEETVSQTITVTSGGSSGGGSGGGNFQASLSVPGSHTAHTPLRAGVDMTGGSGEYTISLMRQESGKSAEIIDSFSTTAGSASSYLLYWSDPAPGTYELFLMIKGGGDITYSGRKNISVQ